MDLKEFLETTIYKTFEEFGEFFIEQWKEIFLDYGHLFKNYPKIKDKNYNNKEFYDDNIESQIISESYSDIEFNLFEIIAIDFETNSFIICVGNDWENTLELTVTIDEKIYFEISSENFQIGLSDEDFLKKVLGNNWEEKIKKLGYKI